MVKIEQVIVECCQNFLDKISIKFNGLKLILIDHVKYLGMYIDKY